MVLAFMWALRQGQDLEREGGGEESRSGEEATGWKSLAIGIWDHFKDSLLTERMLCFGHVRMGICSFFNQLLYAEVFLTLSLLKPFMVSAVTGLQGRVGA